MLPAKTLIRPNWTPAYTDGPTSRGGKQRSSPAGGGTRASSNYQQHQQMAVRPNFAEPPVDYPSFMGAASRKRKWELAAEKGLIPPLGHTQGPAAQPPPNPYGAYKGGMPPYGGKGYGESYDGGGKGYDGGAKGYGESYDGGGKGCDGGGKGYGGGGASRPPAARVPAVAVPQATRGKGLAAKEEPDAAEAWGSSVRGRNGGGGTPNGASVASVAEAAKDAVKWITLPGDGHFVQMGMPELAPTVFHHPGIQTLLSSGQHILADLGMETAEAIMLTHDADWVVYPEVGEAIKAAGGQEQPYCIAECSAKAIWAVGAGSKWKSREQAARLAMCIALAANIEDFEAIAKAQPEFTAFCEALGISTGTQLPGGGMLPPAPLGVKAQASGVKIEQHSGLEMPGDALFWITLGSDEAVQPPLDNLLLESVVLRNDGTTRSDLYYKADAAIALVIGELASEVQYFDDPNWDQFPQVGQHTKRVTGKEECLTLAVCQAAGVWAVGAGRKGKNRMTAAKVAMAASLALQTNDMGQDMDYTELPALKELVEEARAAKTILNGER